MVGLDKLDKVLEKADFIVNVLPKTDETIHFFTKAHFARMKPTTVFMNIGRGQTVVEDDLIEALQSGKIAGAVLDVYTVEPLPKESPLWSMPNVLMYPHSADDDRFYIDRVVKRLFDNIERFKNGQELTFTVDKKLGY